MKINSLLQIRLSRLSLADVILWLLGGMAAVAVIVSVLLLIKIVAPAIDEELGIVTDHAMKSIQEYSQDGKLVQDIVETKYKNPQWRAYHTEYLGDTYVRCTAIKSDGTVVIMQWFVRSRLKWIGGFEIRNVVMTAINEEALNIAPGIRERGRPIYRSPDIAY